MVEASFHVFRAVLDAFNASGAKGATLASAVSTSWSETTRADSAASTSAQARLKLAWEKNKVTALPRHHSKKNVTAARATMRGGVNLKGKTMGQRQYSNLQLGTWNCYKFQVADSRLRFAEHKPIRFGRPLAGVGHPDTRSAPNVFLWDKRCVFNPES